MGSVRFSPGKAELPLAGMTKTGLVEWRTTFSVTLPNTQRLAPVRPWVDIAIKLFGSEARSIISCAVSFSEVRDDTSISP